jgi:hypothetical protein
MAAALVAAVASAAVAAATNPMDIPMRTIASGHMHGQAWTLKAGTSRSNGHAVGCYRFSVGPMDSGGCGDPLELPPARIRARVPYGINLGFVGSCGHLGNRGFVYGLVTSKASDIAIRLSNGKTVHATPVRPSAGLPKGMSYFVTTFPCRTVPGATVARSASGRIVGRSAGMPAMPSTGGSSSKSDQASPDVI